MIYEFEYTETNVGYFDVEADSPEEAHDKFWDLVNRGEIDLLQTDIMDSDIRIVSEFDTEKIDVPFSGITDEVLNTVLEDDDTPYGGTDYAGETVMDFLLDSNIGDYDILSLDDLNEMLELCGIRKVDASK